MSKPKLLACWCALAAVAFAGCGGDDEGSTSAADASPVATAEAVPDQAPPDEAPPDDGGAPDDEAGPGDEAVPDDAAPDEAAAPVSCPSAADVSAAYGAEVRLDEASAMTGGLGLVFCPYDEVLAPDATNTFGLPSTPRFFSITFTDQDIVIPDDVSEEVPGLGQKARWGSFGELTVWTGDKGIIISMIDDPRAGGDNRSASIAIAQLLV